jgi:hypothetical protein
MGSAALHAMGCVEARAMGHRPSRALVVPSTIGLMYDPHSEYFKYWSSVPFSQHETTVATYAAQKATLEESIARKDEVNLDIDNDIQLMRETKLKLMASLKLLKANIQQKYDQKALSNAAKGADVDKLTEIDLKNRISGDIVNKIYQPFAVSIPQQLDYSLFSAAPLTHSTLAFAWHHVQEETPQMICQRENLETEEGWKMLGQDGLPILARKLENLGFISNPACSVDHIRKNRQMVDGHRKHTNDYQAYLQELLSFDTHLKWRPPCR